MQLKGVFCLLLSAAGVAYDNYEAATTANERSTMSSSSSPFKYTSIGTSSTTEPTEPSRISEEQALHSITNSTEEAYTPSGNISDLVRTSDYTTDNTIPTSENINSSLLVVKSPQRATQTKLFSNFVFKGVGISFLKSMNVLKSCGFRFFIPLTQNFPEYDRKVTLPRVVLQTGMFYPYEYRVAIVFSVPLHVALYGASKAFEGTTLTNKDLSQRLKRTKATTSVKRVGISFACGYRMYADKPFVFSVGPWIFYLPGAHSIRNFLSIPSLVYSFIFSLLVLIGIRKRDAIQSSGVVKSTSASSLAAFTTPLYNKLQSLIPMSLQRYIHSKSPGLGYNLGVTRSRCVNSAGATLLFEMQYFYPLLKLLRRMQASIFQAQEEAFIIRAAPRTQGHFYVPQTVSIK